MPDLLQGDPRKATAACGKVEIDDAALDLMSFANRLLSPTLRTKALRRILRVATDFLIRLRPSLSRGEALLAPEQVHLKRG